ncbi:LPS-assembly protein LptD [Muricoccus radiodurans]|uniref:LPS-assembly protein LptD n=1 Tax=Muricoccus radiodurans TaxID=2231721 RepID=UPI003CEE1C33
MTEERGMGGPRPAPRRVPRRGRPAPRPTPLSRRAGLLGGVAFLALMALASPVGQLGQAAAQSGLGGAFNPTQFRDAEFPGAAAAPAGRASGPAGLGTSRSPPVDRNAPVTFTAESVEYDQGENRVTATGKVEAWQGDRILRADRFTYDRNTGVAVAEGNVELLEPDGQVLFADRAELQGGMREAVVDGMRGLLAQNGRVAANGARRTTTESGATITDLARVVYSSCDLCAENPAEPPIWQIRSRLATQDGEARRIRFRDATLDVAGFPTLYTPYISMPDPSTPRSSGFLSPSFGQTRFLGLFTEIPYYWAIDDSSDATITPLISTNQAPALNLAYRRRFNFGELSIEGSAGYLRREGEITEDGFGGSIRARGLFNIDENWRAGFTLNRASSESYLRAFRQPFARVLTSTAYTEGFWGTEAYARVEGLAFQGLRSQDDVGLVPFVLPNMYYQHVFGRDSIGGQLTADVTAFNIYRDAGTKTRRAGTRLNYDVPRIDNIGGVWTFRAQLDALGYNADDVNLSPNFSSNSTLNEATGNVRVAIDWRLPMVREVTEFGGGLGQQLIEPRIQIVTGPNMGRQSRIPNEDSLDFEFTDANLFALNRFVGRDRQEGGTRVDAAFRAAWLFPNGGQIEGLVGRSFRASREEVFEARSGLRDQESDWVGRIRVQPTPWLNVVARARLDGETLDRRMLDTQANLGLEPLGLGRTSLNLGYVYNIPLTIQSPRRYTREVYGGAQTQVSQFWRAGVFGRYDIEDRRGVAVGMNLTYEDECLILDGRFYQSYAQNPTTLQDYPSGTVLLLRIGLKTIGDFGIRAL